MFQDGAEQIMLRKLAHLSLLFPSPPDTQHTRDDLALANNARYQFNPLLNGYEFLVQLTAAIL